MKYTDGWKYRLEEGFAYKLKYNYERKTDFVTEWFTLTTDNWLLVKPGYASDGATLFPDFEWLKTPAIAIHDPLCNAIEMGAIPERMNDLIDKELEEAIRGSAATKISTLWLLKLRGWYIRKGTNLADSKSGRKKKVHFNKQLEREYTFNQYYNETGKRPV